MSTEQRDTPFLEAVRVEPVPGSKSLFTANVPSDWCGTPAAHGGFLQTLIFSTARTYFLTHHPARNQPDPIAGHTQFLKQVWAGPVQLSVRPVNIGSRVSVIQIELIQSTVHSISQSSRSHSENDEFVTGVIATITQGNIAMESGPSLRTMPTIPKEDIPDRERDCVELVEPDYIREIAPTSTKVNRRWLPVRPDETVDDYQRRSFRDIWMKLAEGSNWDILSLGYLTDMFGGAPSNYASDNNDYMSGIFYPTVSIATDIKKDPKNSKWLFLRIRAHAIKNGRFDTDVRVVDEMGDLVCLSRHVSLILSKVPLEYLHKIYKL